MGILRRVPPPGAAAKPKAGDPPTDAAPPRKSDKWCDPIGPRGSVANPIMR